MDIFTKRLRLREITEEDTTAIVELRGNPDIYKYFLYPHQITRDEHIEWYKNTYLGDDCCMEWMALDEYNNKIGVFGIKFDIIKKSGELSYILNPKYEGKGYAKESVIAIMEYATENFGCYNFEAQIHKGNKQSICFVLKLGFNKKVERGKFVLFEKSVKGMVF